MYYKVERGSTDLFFGRKICFIKTVRQATGCGLWLAKHTVDLCMAVQKAKTDVPAAIVGDFGDFTVCVRFICLLKENGIDISHVGGGVRAAILHAIRQIEKTEDGEKNLSDLTVDFWNDAYDRSA